MAEAAFTIEYMAPGELVPNPHNFRRHPEAQRRALSSSIAEHGWVDAPLFNRTSGHLIDGHARVEEALAAGEERIPVKVVALSLAAERRLLRSFDAITGMALTDDAALEALIAEIDDASLEQLLGELAETAVVAADAEEGEARQTLAERFGVPPFSVLDARQGYWQARKRAWIALGIESELGRGDVMPSGEGSCDSGSSEWSRARGGGRRTLKPPGQQGGPSDHWRNWQHGRTAPGGSPRPAAKMGEDGHTLRGDGAGRPFAGEASGTSIFDPVLCELVYRWFCPEAGRVLDPFAGGSVRGIVACVLGRSYVGVDLSAGQLSANRPQAEAIGVAPEWIVGDSRDLHTLVTGEFDCVFSCPPYADLERYSDDPRDLSTLDYEEFLAAYRQIIAAAVGRLKENRFACFCVGDVRDPRGFYRSFVADTVAAFAAAGMPLYNDAILVTMVGSLPLRTGLQFASYRKLGKTHQNVLVFYKGDPKRIKEIAADCEFGDLALELDEDVSLG